MSPFAVRDVVVRVPFVCALAVYGLVNAAAPAPGSGYATVVRSVLDDCYFDANSTEPAAVCLKSKALTALDRALSKPTVTVVDGVTLVARAGKSPSGHQQTERADSEALNAARDSDHKSELLDDMIAARLNRLVSTRTIVFDGLAEGQEGRKKKDKGLQQALMMAGMTAAAVMGPLAFKMIALIAGKALVISKIALVLSGLIALKKLVQPQHSGDHETVSYHHGRNMRPQDEAQDVAYSAQRQETPPTIT